MRIPFSKTKIIATVGPSARKKETLYELIQAGADVFRLNFSHGSHEEHAGVIEDIRTLNEEHGLNIGIIQDLQGPKIRVGEIENDGVELIVGKHIKIVSEDIKGNAEKIGTSYSAFADDVKPGDQILMDDGNIELKVLDVSNGEVTAEIIYGGILKPKKGINLPDTSVSAASLTEKDKKDLKFGLSRNVEWIALSFVRSAADIQRIKNTIEKEGKQVKVIAKIEKPEALKNIDDIIAVSDAVMVARGDLGVEMPMEEVPMIQKMIVEKCNRASKPVIIATQMMESMIYNPRPTRAETNDIANAVIDGADALMLSAETAAGMFPVQAVESMGRTIKTVEKSAAVYDKYYDLDTECDTYYNDSVIASACKLAKHTGAKALIGMTRSGYTAFEIAKHRSEAHIFIFSDNRPMLNTMSLIWGVRAFYYDGFVSTDDTIEDLKNILINEGHLTKGDILINTASMPIKEKQRTNMIKLSIVN